MSTNCYQIAYEHAMNEIAEIDAQIQRLMRRKELLGKLLEPLELLVPEAVSTAIPAANSDASNSEASSTEAAPVVSTVVVLVDPGPLEDPVPMTHAEAEKANGHARTNGRPVSEEDVAGLAYRFWDDRGRVHGHHEDDWFRAAYELQNSV